LHVRAILGLPIPNIELLRHGASHVVLADKESSDFKIEGIDEAMKMKDINVRVFGKPTTRVNRRMAVVLGPSIDKVKEAAKKIKII